MFKGDIDSKYCKQRLSMRATDFSQLLWTRDLCCGLVDDEYCLRRNFIIGFPLSIHQSRKTYWETKKGISTQKLAQHALLLTHLQLRISPSEKSKMTKIEQSPASAAKAVFNLKCTSSLGNLLLNQAIQSLDLDCWS